MPTPPLEILYEDNHLLVVNKPAGLPTMGVPGAAHLAGAGQGLHQAPLRQARQRLLGVMSRLERRSPAWCSCGLEGRRAA